VVISGVRYRRTLFLSVGLCDKRSSVAAVAGFPCGAQYSLDLYHCGWPARLVGCHAFDVFHRPLLAVGAQIFLGRYMRVLCDGMPQRAQLNGRACTLQGGLVTHYSVYILHQFDDRAESCNTRCSCLVTASLCGLLWQLLHFL
jgi:hypothetical protein